MPDGFIGRWSRRKQAVQTGIPVQEPLPVVVTPAAPPPARGAAAPQPVADPPIASAEAEAALPLPTLEDVQALTPQSDFKPFMASKVAPEVKNAAMKKLFTDPHFNVMDGLDIYIDDYSRPDPLPQSMLRKMASAQFLNLVEPEPNAPDPGTPRQPAAPAVAAPATQAMTDPPAGQPETSQAPMTAPGQATVSQPTSQDHADTDLRLQQDHAAGPQGSGGGPQ